MSDTVRSLSRAGGVIQALDAGARGIAGYALAEANRRKVVLVAAFFAARASPAG